MSIPYRRTLTPVAQQLRTNMTPQERKLWYDFLKQLPITVKRQHPLHNYIPDFYIESKKIAIEIDGRQHLTDEHKEEDQKRDAELGGLGILVLRYPNIAISRDFRLVCEDIMKHINSR